MRVHNHAVHGIKRVLLQGVRGLAPDASQGQQLLHSLRYLAPEVLHQRFAGFADVGGFRVRERDAFDHALKLTRRRCEHIRRRLVLRIQRRRGLIHDNIRALRGQDRGEQEVKGRVELEVVLRVWIRLFKY